MANVNEIIIEVEVNAGESAELLAQTTAKIDQLKDAQKKLKATMKELQQQQLAGAQISKEDQDVLAQLTAQYATNAADLKQLTSEEKMYTAQLNIATQGNRQYGDSLVEMSAQLAQLKQEYRGLSAAQRESDAGKALQKQIADLDQTLKDSDASLGDWQRNVGHYQQALLGLGGNAVKVANLFEGGFTQSLKAAGTAVSQLAKKLLLNPIIAAVAAAFVILKKAVDGVKDAFQRNDDAGTALQKSLAALKPVASAVKAVFDVLATAVAAVVGGITKAVTAIGRLVPAFRDAQDAAVELVEAEDKLQDKQREYTVAAAERQRKVAELKKKERADENLTFEEKEKIYKEIDELERKDLEEKKALAAENLRIIEQRAKQERDTSDATKDKIAEARAAMLRAETEYLQGTTRIAARAAAAREQEQKAQEEAAKKAAENWKRAAEQRKQALKVQEDELRKLEDLRLNFIKDEFERERKETELSYKRQIEDLEKRLKEEKNLTKTAREAIQNQIIALKAQETQALYDLDQRQKKSAQEALDNALDALGVFQKKFGSVTDAVSFTGRKAAEDVLKAYEGTGEQMAEWYEKQEQRYANAVQERLNAVYGNVVEAANIELEVAQHYYDSLVGMDAATKDAMFKNEEDYKAAVLAAEAQMLQAREKAAQAMEKQVKDIASIMKTFTSAMSSMFEAVSEDSETYEYFKKAIAIADATISAAQATAAATAAVAAEGDPYTTALRIAEAVAAVGAAFATVIKSLKSTDIPSAPSFEQGGIVPGNSLTGDKVDVKANSREMILTLPQQSRLWDMITDGTPPEGIDYDLMAMAFASAVSQLPAPVLNYSEFQRFQRDVRYSEMKIR